MAITKVRNPNGSIVKIEHPDDASQEDILGFAASQFNRGQGEEGIVGDITKNEAVNAFSNIVNRWENKNVEIPFETLPEPNKKGKVYFVDVPNAKQSEIRIGYLSVPRTHPD